MSREKTAEIYWPKGITDPEAPAQPDLKKPPKKPNGFAAMSPEQRTEVRKRGAATLKARMGDKYIEYMREKGRKGGRRISENRAHMKALGDKVSSDREHMAELGRKSAAKKRENRLIENLSNTEERLKRQAEKQAKAEARYGVGYRAKKNEYLARVPHEKWVCPDVNKGCIRCKFETHDPWFKCVKCGQIEGNLDKSCKGSK